MNDAENATASGEGSEIGFADAMKELERIVAELESDDVDVDVMAERVERAATLVALCRERLDSTRYRVEEIIVRIDNSATGGEETVQDDQDPSGPADG